MPQSLVRITMHVVFSTKQRRALILDALAPGLHAYLGGILSRFDSPPLEIGGVGDHVHLLFDLSKKHGLVEVMRELKRGSSKWAKTQGREYADFYWQNGYGAFAVSQSQIEPVRRYIRCQLEHHRTMTFEDEYRRLLRLNELAFDERYVWD